MHFRTDPLAREARKTVEIGGAGGKAFGVKACFGIGVKRVKAEKPQDAQVIFADARLGVADKAQAAGDKIGQSRRAGR